MSREPHNPASGKGQNYAYKLEIPDITHFSSWLKWVSCFSIAVWPEPRRKMDHKCNKALSLIGPFASYVMRDWITIIINELLKNYMKGFAGFHWLSTCWQCTLNGSDIILDFCLLLLILRFYSGTNRNSKNKHLSFL